MSSLLIVDASIGVKWVLLEADSLLARTYAFARLLWVPDFFWIETANVLLSKQRKGELDKDTTASTRDDLLQAPVQTILTQNSHIEQAFTLAQQLRHPIYDCLYLAHALAKQCPLFTADSRFAKAVSTHPDLGKRLIYIKDIDDAHR
jgi:predicted nucleic acid-binding protein